MFCINTKLPSVISSKFDLIFKQTRRAKFLRGVKYSSGVQYASQSRVESTDKQVEGRHDHGEAHGDVIDDDRRRVVLVKMQATVAHQVEGQAQDAHQDLPGRRQYKQMLSVSALEIPIKYKVTGWFSALQAKF